MLAYNLTKIKLYLRLPITFEDDDELLKSLFDSITPDVTKFIGFDLSATTYTEEVHIKKWWERTLQTKAFPILDPVDEEDDIIVITINDGKSVGLDNFNYDPITGDILFITPYNLYYGYPENNIKVTYRAGYTTFPKDAEKSIYKLIKIEYEEGGNDLKSIDDLSSKEIKRDLIGNYPPDVYRVLNSYRRNVV